MNSLTIPPETRPANPIKRGPALTLLASLLLSLLYSPPVAHLFPDEAVFRYAGMLIARGGVPYRDLFDHKPPLIYFMDCGAHVLGSWGYWITDTLLVTGATLFFYKRCREKQLPYPWILPLLFNLLIRDYMLGMGVGTTRACTTIFLLIAFCLLSGRTQKPSTRSYTFFWLGLLASATLLMQQDQLLTLLPFLAYAFIDQCPTLRIFLIRLAQAAAGFMVIAGPILLYFGIHHALGAFWQDAFMFNLTWYADRRSLGEQFRAIHAALNLTELGMLLLICSTLAVTALLVHARQKLLILASLAAAALSFTPELISGRVVDYMGGFVYYYTPLAAVLPILAFTAWTATDHPFLRSRISHAVFGFLICAPMVYNAVRLAAHLSLHNERNITATAEYRFIDRQRPTDYQLYIFGNNHWTYVYNRLGILAPSPWIYHHFWQWYPGWDAGHHILASIGHDLLAHHTRYVVDFSGEMTFTDHGAYACWKSFLQKYYQLVPLPGSHDSTVWQLRQDSTNIHEK
ncbi:MAG TPA: hypothetical protein VG605_09530 [Puia sp.]|nr:hypothetical protein [Puia sp.]